MTPEGEASLAAAMARKAGPAAPLRAMAPTSLMIVTCEGRPRLYADALDADAARDRRQAWAMVQGIYRARRMLRTRAAAAALSETGGAA
ncbi:hypothetical protein [uncultured Albimonas sp.]|uniref:hypothetical protein n=1 Tax=uncultured Albimonas sp. TaxID=1331701 RepID=UPI0030EF8EEF